MSAVSITVDYDVPRSTYLARSESPLEIDHIQLRDIIRGMIGAGELAPAGYDVGQGGGWAFKLGSLGRQSPIREIDNVGDVCTALEVLLQERCEAAAA